MDDHKRKAVLRDEHSWSDRIPGQMSYIKERLEPLIIIFVSFKTVSAQM